MNYTDYTKKEILEEIKMFIEMSHLSDIDKGLFMELILEFRKRGE